MILIICTNPGGTLRPLKNKKEVSKMKTIKMVEHKNETHEEYKARINAKIKELGKYYVTQSYFDNSLANGNKSYIMLYYYTFPELLKHKAEHLFGDVYRYENKVYKILQQNGKLPQDFSVVEIQEYDLEHQRKEYERIHELATSLVEFEKEHSYTPKMKF